VYVVFFLFSFILIHSIFFLLFLSSCSHFGAQGWLFSFMIILQTVGLLGRVISSLYGPYTHTHTHQTSMPYGGFELRQSAPLPWPVFKMYCSVIFL
jgi:hypothetical protein